MSKLIVPVLCATAWLWSLQVSAAVSLTEWGATARTISADCTLAFTGECSSVLAFDDGEIAGGSHETSATIGSAVAGSAIGLQGRGTAGAEAVISAGGLNLPVLRARAESAGENLLVAGSAIAAQGYQFTGFDGTEISLDVSLTGSVNNFAGSLVTGLEANIWILTDTSLFTFPTDPAVSIIDVLAGIYLNAIFAGGPDPFAGTLSWDAASTGIGPINRSTEFGGSDPDDRLNFTLNNGDEFYLFAGLSAIADGVDASAMSWSTLTVDFNTLQLQAASVVPIPAAIWFFGSSLVALLSLRKQ